MTVTCVGRSTLAASPWTRTRLSWFSRRVWMVAVADEKKKRPPKSGKKRNLRVLKITRDCSKCGAEITVPLPQVRDYNYCNSACYHGHRKERTYRTRSDAGVPRSPRVTRQCPECGQDVEVLESFARYRKHSFCSLEHRNKWAGRKGGGASGKPYGSTMRQNRGYILEKTERGWIMQHRVVMERMLGRPLLKEENVHHINGVRDDNRPENLELWLTMQPTGQRVRDLVAFAHEILARYENEGHDDAVV